MNLEDMALIISCATSAPIVVAIGEITAEEPLANFCIQARVEPDQAAE